MKEIAKRYALLTGLIVLLSFIFYLGWSLNLEGLGFPLDDSWIHQTYGRNLGEKFQWSFLLDSPSGGSTGPVWGFLISFLYLINIPYLYGTFLLGFLLLWGSAFVAVLILDKFNLPNKYVKILAGIMIGLEWHLVWAALSGMETILLIFLILLIFYWFFNKWDNWWLPGLLIGLSLWIRPDGLTLLGPALVILYFRNYSIKTTLRKLFSMIGCFCVLFSLYILFNWIVAGDIWPNTFYAKQAEYAILREIGYVYRYVTVGLQFLTGIGILLLPGILIEIKIIVQKREWEKIAAIIWVLGYFGLYAWKLPVTYQHGRYIMPAMPLGFIFGLAGLLHWIDLKSKQFWRRFTSGVWVGATIVVSVTFWILGARTYSRDVAVIETEMVHVSKWINENTEDDTFIAAHDIGALGYFSNRNILDLAGLITPDVIPFIRNEMELGSYIDQYEIDYLMTFPDWYPKLTNGLDLAYQSKGKYAPEFGSTNMALYHWK